MRFVSPLALHSNTAVNQVEVASILSATKKALRPLLGARVLLGHTGSNTGWEAAVFLHVESRAGLVMLTNSELGQRVLRPVVAAWAQSLEAAK